MRRKNKKTYKYLGEVKFLTKRIKVTRFQNFFVFFYGLGSSTADQISGRFGCNLYFIEKEQTFWKKVESYLDSYYYFGRPYEKEMKSKVLELQKIGCYKGIRFSQGLPVNGQRTHTNGRTMKRIYGKK
jgi:small subunit ribosomal protein S13